MESAIAGKYLSDFMQPPNGVNKNYVCAIEGPVAGAAVNWIFGT
jgi:hypothetical protein